MVRSEEPDALGAGDAVERHRSTLIAEAIDISRQQPQLRIVGIVIEPGAPEAEAFRRLLPPESRDPRQGFVGTVTRDIALKILGSSTPALLDWLEDEGAGPRRKLPVVHAAARGMRTTAFEYDLPD